MSENLIGTNSVYPKPKSMVGLEIETPTKYKYWVYAICQWTNDSGYNVSLDYGFTFETDHKFNSHSISECSNKIRVNVSADQGLNAVQESEMKIVIRFFGLLED